MGCSVLFQENATARLPVPSYATEKMRQKKTPRFFGRGGWQSCSNLKQIPEELVVDLVVELDFLRFDEGSEGAGAAVGGGLLKVCVAALDVLAEQG
jgi:hypothetical protein